MLLLLLEIGLTIAAWKRGWKGWALLPLAIGMSAGFLFGLVVGATGGSEAELFGVGVVLDVVCVITLIIMTVKGRRVAENPPVNLNSEHSIESRFPTNYESRVKYH